MKRGNPDLPLSNRNICSRQIRHKRDVSCQKSGLGRIFESESATGNFDWSTILELVLVFLGGMIAGITGLVLDNHRRRNELRTNHLESIKDLCLTPIYQALTRLATEYDLVESKYEATLLGEMLQGRHQWWKVFSFQDKSDKALYHDLANHFKDLPSILKKTEDCISSMTPLYFQRVLNLEIDIHQALKKNFQSASFFKELSTDEKQAYQNLTDEEKRRASFQILRISVSKSAEEKLDAISEIKRFITSNEKVEVLKKIATAFSNSNNAKEVANLRLKIDGQISECLNALAEAKLFTKLKGKCKYL